MCYLMKYYISDYWNKGIKGHSNYDFVDVAVNDDNLLFIDPILLASAGDEWSQEAKQVVNSFFDTFYEAYRNKDKKSKIELLSHAGEQNGTRFGYGCGNNGKGNTAQGLLEVFKPLEYLIKEIATVEKAEDLLVLMPNFAEDGLSDLITNILHEQLNRFTLLQMDKYEIRKMSPISFWTWDKKQCYWKKVERLSYCVDGQEVLVVPKHIVRKKYLFSTSQYFNRIILDRIRKEGGYMYAGKPISKRDVLKAKRYSGEHWQYDEVISYTQKHNDALREYHQKIQLFYNEYGHPMENEDLDELIYGYPILQTA